MSVLITANSSLSQTRHSINEPHHLMLSVLWISKERLKLIFVALCFFFPAGSSAVEIIDQCKETLVVVHYKDIEAFQTVCDSIDDIIYIANKIGIDLSLNITISVVENLSITHAGIALALFKPSTMELQVLSFDECEKRFINSAVFGQKIDKELYKSIVIHELAHVLAWKNLKGRVVNREILEYFSYVIQIALLDSVHREKILLSNDVEAFSDISEITEEYYYLNPDLFAIKSYLHFANKKNRWTYLRDIFEE